MLLRRMIEHVRTQNWIAVFLDFVIVVVGVFIGIQVSNWNELRNERLASVSFEQRIESDLRNQIKEYDAMIGYYEAVRGSALRTFERLGEDADLDDEAFLIDAYRATQYTNLTNTFISIASFRAPDESACSVKLARRRVTMPSPPCLAGESVRRPE